MKVGDARKDKVGILGEVCRYDPESGGTRSLDDCYENPWRIDGHYAFTTDLDGDIMYGEGTVGMAEWAAHVEATTYGSYSDSISSELKADVFTADYVRKALKRTVKAAYKTVSYYVPCKLKSVKLSKSTYAYGSNVKSALSGKLAVKSAAGTKLKAGRDYKLVWDKDAEKVGRHKVTIKGVGKWSGKKAVSYKVVPATPKASVKAKKKAIKVKASSKGSVSGYQYSLRLGGRQWKDCWVAKKASGKRLSKTVRKYVGSFSNPSGKLLSGKKYKVKVRAYKKVKGKTYYSKWSKAKTVKVK